MLKLKLQYFVHLMQELTHWKRPWPWEGQGAGGEGDDRGWDGWMASPTRWTWVWVNSGSWWWTTRSGVLWFMGSQRVGHDWATELNWTKSKPKNVSFEPSEERHYHFQWAFFLKITLCLVLFTITCYGSYTSSVPPSSLRKSLVFLVWAHNMRRIQSHSFLMFSLSSLFTNSSITCSVTKSCLTLWPYGLQHTGLICPPLSLRICSR